MDITTTPPTTPEQAQAAAMAIWDKYRSHYDHDVQGCCPLIADEIQRAVGGDVVAGEITWYGGACRRTHWWVDLDGVVLDPIGDWVLSFEESTGRQAHHQDRHVFESILPRYEQWRIGDAWTPSILMARS